MDTESLILVVSIAAVIGAVVMPAIAFYLFWKKSGEAMKEKGE